MTKAAVVVYSGGMDSFTLLNMAVRKYGADRVSAFTLDYGQRHVKEVEFAEQVTAQLKVDHSVLAMPMLRDFLGGSALTSDVKVPEGHYADESMKQTVVPNRNMILLSLAIGLAVRDGAEEVWTGVHAGDHAIYPDCRPEFIHAMNHVTSVANHQRVAVVTPFLRSTKGDIVKAGLNMGLDYGLSWTCYNGRAKACGVCGSCRERIESFEQNNATDPLEYEGA